MGSGENERLCKYKVPKTNTASCLKTNPAPPGGSGLVRSDATGRETERETETETETETERERETEREIHASEVNVSVTRLCEVKSGV